jgi:hypothetical protein
MHADRRIVIGASRKGRLCRKIDAEGHRIARCVMAGRTRPGPERTFGGGCVSCQVSAAGCLP